MKNILILFMAMIGLFSTPAFGQSDFEGTIVFSVSMTGEGADEMKGFLPEAYQYTIKGNAVRFKMIGGMTAAMMGDIIVDGATGNSYMLKPAEEVAYEFTQDADETPAAEPKPEVKKLAEVIEIAGYKCQKYSVKMLDEGGNEAMQYVWVTNQIHVMPGNGTKSLGSGSNMFIEGIDGFPLKVETDVMGMKMVILAKSVTKEKLSAAEFKVPSNYKIEPFDPNSLMGDMGR